MNETLCRWDGDALLLTVYTQPGASRDEVVALEPRGLRVRVKTPPVEGAANKRLIEVLAKAFGVSKRKVELKKGHATRVKLVRIVTPAKIPSYLQEIANPG